MSGSRSIVASRTETVRRFRRRLLEIIQRSGLSRSGFARKVGVDRSTLAQILSSSSDRLPRIETLTAIAATEHVSIDWLVGLSEEGSLGPDILEQRIELRPGGLSPADESLQGWRQEALGYKIRHVPTTFPDLFKTDAVIEYEYHPAVATTPEHRHVASRVTLAYERRPETDTEVCSPIQDVESFARGQGIWSGLTVEQRRAQLERMGQLVDELYPTFRWFLFDALQQFSVPLTVFGPKRAAIYVGQMYLVITSSEHIKVLSTHFDSLIRAAVVQPPDVPSLLGRLYEEVS